MSKHTVSTSPLRVPLSFVSSLALGMDSEGGMVSACVSRSLSLTSSFLLDSFSCSCSILRSFCLFSFSFLKVANINLKSFTTLRSNSLTSLAQIDLYKISQSQVCSSSYEIKTIIARKRINFHVCKYVLETDIPRNAYCFLAINMKTVPFWTLGGQVVNPPIIFKLWGFMCKKLQWQIIFF